MTRFFESTPAEQLAFETIEFQSDAYARDIEVLIATLKKELDADERNYRTLSKHPTIKLIETKTLKRTGLKIKLHVNSHLAAVLPFYPNPYGIFVKAHGVEEAVIPTQDKILKASKVHVGTVDLRKCTVSGLFSEYEVPLYLNLRQLFQFGLAPSEITGVFLHELGHAFHGCEYSNRLNMTNQVLADLFRNSIQKKDLPKEYLFKELEKINPKTTQDELEKILNGKNVILGRSTFRFLKETIESQMPTNFYNENSFETMADNFAARWGYGKQVVTGLEKFYDSPLYKFRQSALGTVVFSSASFTMVGYLVYQILNVLGFGALGSTIAGVSGTASGIFFGTSLMMAFVLGYILLIVLMMHSTYGETMTYDELKHRYKRVRNQIVELLKDTDLSGKQIDEAIASIHTLDEIIDGKKSWTNFLTLVVDFLTPGSGKIEDDMKTQRVLEELSANDLFIRAAALRRV